MLPPRTCRAFSHATACRPPSCSRSVARKWRPMAAIWSAAPSPRSIRATTQDSRSRSTTTTRCPHAESFSPPGCATRSPTSLVSGNAGAATCSTALGGEPVLVHRRCRPPGRWDRGAEARWRQSHDVPGAECIDQQLPNAVGLAVTVYQRDCHDVASSVLGVTGWSFRCRRSQATACRSTVAACGVCGAGVTPGSSVSACAMSGTTTRSTRAGSS